MGITIFNKIKHQGIWTFIHILELSRAFRDQKMIKKSTAAFQKSSSRCHCKHCMCSDLLGTAYLHPKRACDHVIFLNSYTNRGIFYISQRLIYEFHLVV